MFTGRGTGMSKRRIDALAVVGLAAATALVCLPLFLRPWSVPADYDFPSHAFHAAFDRWAIVHFHQFAFRSPYHTGGYPVFAYPDDIALSPRLLLHLAVGTTLGMKLDYALCLFLAAGGTYLLMRHQMGLAVPGALVSGIIVGFGGCLQDLWMVGWVINCRAAVFPWVLYAWWRSRRHPWWLVLCGCLMATMLLDAKYGLASLSWFMLILVLLRLDGGKDAGALPVFPWRRVVLLVAVVAWAFLLAGVKLVPFAPLLWHHVQGGGQGRPIQADQVVLWLGLLTAFTVLPAVLRLQPARRARLAAAGVALAVLVLLAVLCPRPGRTWEECVPRLRGGIISLVGTTERAPGAGVVRAVIWIGPALAVAGIALRGRRLWRWVLIAGVLLWMALGDGAPVSLQRSVRALPGLSLIRQAEAWFGIYLVFAVAVLAGHGAMLRSGAGRSGRRIAPWLLAGVCLAAAVAQSWPKYRVSASAPPAERGGAGPYFMVSSGTGYPEDCIALMYRNIGVAEWGLDLYDPRTAAVRPRSRHVGGPVFPTYRGEAYFRDPAGPNRARLTMMTPLEMRVAVDVQRPGRLCLNQLRDRQWRTSEGVLSTRSPTLAVELTRTGTYDVRLRYVPVLFYWGLGVTVASLAGGPVVIGFARRRRRKMTAG